MGSIFFVLVLRPLALLEGPINSAPSVRRSIRNPVISGLSHHFFRVFLHEVRVQETRESDGAHIVRTIIIVANMGLMEHV